MNKMQSATLLGIGGPIVLVLSVTVALILVPVLATLALQTQYGYMLQRLLYADQHVVMGDTLDMNGNVLIGGADATFAGTVYAAQVVETDPPDIWTLGALTTVDIFNVVNLTNTMTDIPESRYDTFQEPRDTDYQVPVGKTLYITMLSGQLHAQASPPHHIEIGYGDVAVANSEAAPTGVVVVYLVSWEDSETEGPEPWSVFIPIPAGKFPWVHMSRIGNVQAVGVVK